MTDDQTNSKVPGWFMSGSEPGQYSAMVDKETFHSGTQSAKVTNSQPSASGFGTLMQEASPDEYKGKRWRMTFWLKTEAVQGWTSGWMRVDGKKGDSPLAFDNMQDRLIKGTTDWRQYSIVLDVSEQSTKIAFGIMLSGDGKIWIDDIQFEEVDNSVPVTCMYARKKYLTTAKNLNFEESTEAQLKPGLIEGRVLLNSLPASAEDKVNSIASNTHSSITIFNKTPGALKVFWIDFEGKREMKGRVSGEQTREFHTFDSHPWLITDEDDKVLGLFVATENHSYGMIES